MLTRALRVLAAALAVVGLFAIRAGTASADEKNPWDKLKVGDWAEYKSSPSPNMEAHSKWVVKEVTADKVVYVVETSILMDGKPIDEPTKTELTYDKKKAEGDPKDKPKTTESKETVKVDGKELKCTVITAEGEAAGQKYTTKTWMCDDVRFGINKFIESKETVKVDGKELKCTVITNEGEWDRHQYTTKTWMCGDVPFGIVKSMYNGNVTQELVKWGSK